jgi:hypothetical protein
MIQTVCGTCKEPISYLIYQIDGMASCSVCYNNHKISYNPLPCPYKQPRNRTLSKQQPPQPESRLGGWFHHTQAGVPGLLDWIPCVTKVTPGIPTVSSVTSVAKTNDYIINPVQGL